MPADCMMSMMEDGENMDDCDCSIDGMQCQRCDADFLNTSIPAIELKLLILASSNITGLEFTLKQELTSVSLRHLSPPPII